MKPSDEHEDRRSTWWARNIVDDNLYDGIFAQPTREKRERLWVGIGLAIMAASAIATSAFLIMLARWASR